MPWRRRAAATIGVAALAAVAFLAQPAPPVANANPACDVATGPIGWATDAVGVGNPVGDVCNTVTGGIGGVGGVITSPVTGALKGIGNSVFTQLTSWVAEGAGWLMGQVVEAIESSTTPQLETRGFLQAYWRMAAIATVLAAVMLLLAILEAIAQGNLGLIVRVIILNVPLAFLGTSVAFVIVQMLLTCTDGLSAAVADASHHGATRFFEAAVGDLGQVGGAVGKQAGEAGGEAPTGGLGGEAAGAVAVPLFVGFLAAIVGAFAAFFVWLELLMRDAAIYAVASFMPLSLVTSIWPRWSGVLRKTSEVLIALIGSKFVIVAVISLAAALIAEEGSSVEHVLAAAALMCVACFVPFMLLRWVAFSEGALAAAYGRRSAATTVHHSASQMASNAQLVRSMNRSQEGSGVSLWSASQSRTPGNASKAGDTRSPGGPLGDGKGTDRGAGGGAGSASASRAASAAASAGRPASPAAAAASGAAVAKAPKAAAGRLKQTSSAHEVSGGVQSGGDRDSGPGTSTARRPGTAPESPGVQGDPKATGSSPSLGENLPRPSSGQAVPPPADQTPRPAPEAPKPKSDEPGAEQ